MEFTTPVLETKLATKNAIYPTLRNLVRLLSWNRQQVVSHLQSAAKENPFILENLSFSPVEQQETLLGDVLPEWYELPDKGITLQEHLRGQISALSISSRQQKALIYLTQWLSPSGYLEKTPEVWTTSSCWSPWELQTLVPLLQSLDPPGIGARSLRECLLLQLQSSQLQNLLVLLVSNYLEELAHCTGSCLVAQQNCQQLLQKLHQNHQIYSKTTLTDLQTAICHIQALEPLPARNFSNSSNPIVTPDLQVECQSSQEWRVSLIDDATARFSLNFEALKLLQQTNQRSQDIKKLELLLNQARTLLTALSQWQENLLKVGQFLVVRQQEFLHSQNTLDLIPTSQQLVAQSVGISNATVSRIVQGRYLLVCNQNQQPKTMSRKNIIPLSSLCVPVTVGGRTPQQVQQLLMQIVQTESTTSPYTDAQIAQLLKINFSIAIARRTVAKYRQIAGIAPAHTRRRNIN